MMNTEVLKGCGRADACPYGGMAVVCGVGAKKMAAWGFPDCHNVCVGI